MVTVGVLVADAADLGQLHVRVRVQVGILALDRATWLVVLVEPSWLG